MSRLLPILAALPILLAFGFAEGTWTDRWHQSDATDSAARKLGELPKIVGDWESQQQEIDPRVAVKAELSGGFLRQYTHRTNGATLTVHLVCGRPGPISLHTPDVCFTSAGVVLTESPKVQALRDVKSARFNVGVFRRGEDSLVEYHRAFWGWSADGEWSAPSSPRMAFARAPALYKLYVVRHLTRQDEPLADDPAQDFLGVFLPQLREFLFSTAGPGEHHAVR